MRDQPGINAERWKPLGPKGFILQAKARAGQSKGISVDDVLDLAQEVIKRNDQYEIF